MASISSLSPSSARKRKVRSRRTIPAPISPNAALHSYTSIAMSCVRERARASVRPPMPPPLTDVRPLLDASRTVNTYQMATRSLGGERVFDMKQAVLWDVSSNFTVYINSRSIGSDCEGPLLRCLLSDASTTCRAGKERQPRQTFGMTPKCDVRIHHSNAKYADMKRCAARQLYCMDPG